jgi:hypothetical protein
MSYKTNYELYVSNYLYNSTKYFSNVILFSLEGASIADAHRRPMSFSHRWQRFTHMSQPCSPNTTPATAPSPVITIRDIGLQPIRRSLSRILSCPRVAAVVSIYLVHYTSVASDSNITLDGLQCRFVSKLRRLLSRDDLKSRRGSRATA